MTSASATANYVDQEGAMISADPLLDVMERIGCGAVVLDEQGSVLSFNASAGRLLNQKQVSSERAIVREMLKNLLRRGSTRFRIDSQDWILVERHTARPLALHAVPIGPADDVNRRTMVIIIDLEDRPKPSLTALQRMFGLSTAEAKLALQIAQGVSPTEIAEARDVKLATIRTQLASVFSKTHTKRQTELVALLARVSVLP